MIEPPMRSRVREVRCGNEVGRQVESDTRTEPVTVSERAFVGVGGVGVSSSSSSRVVSAESKSVEEELVVVAWRKGARTFETKFEVVLPQI